MNIYKSWSLLSYGLIILAGGSLSLILLLHYWEKALIQQLKQSNAISPSNPIDKDLQVNAWDPSLKLKESYQSEQHSHLLTESTKELNLLKTSLTEIQNKNSLLIEDIEHKTKELAILREEKDEWINQAELSTQNFADYKIFSEEQLKQNANQINALQMSVDEYKAIFESNQNQIQQLETKVHDLSYEIKTLLYLQEAEPAFNTAESSIYQESNKINPYQNPTAPPYTPQPIEEKHLEIKNEQNSFEKTISNPAQASALLRHSISIAQKLMGTNYYGSETSRYWEFIPHYTLDQRQLFDSLSNETSGLIIVYSPKEGRVLFANNLSKQLLGWGSDKFVQDFNSIIQEGLPEWKNSINLLASSSESQTRLLMKSKYGKETLMNCHLGVIRSGLFRNYIIGVLYT